MHTTTRLDGDVHPLRTPPVLLSARQLASTGRRWTMLDQRHGVEVVHIDPGSGEHSTNAQVLPIGDIALVERPGTAIAVWAADCAPVMLFGARGRVAGVHAGWRGLASGVLDVALDALDDDVVRAVLGPVIHPCCYAFGPDDLARVGVGAGVDADRLAGWTSDGELALDVPAAITGALARRGVPMTQVGECTSCSGRYFSHRRGDAERHAVVGWWEPS
ncbi:MAG: polyphenol oxidase family protein [Actinomycetota bacterium]